MQCLRFKKSRGVCVLSLTKLFRLGNSVLFASNTRLSWIFSEYTTDKLMESKLQTLNNVQQVLIVFQHCTIGTYSFRKCMLSLKNTKAKKIAGAETS